MHLPATVERRRRHSATHQPGSDRQSAPQSPMVRVEGSPVPGCDGAGGGTGGEECGAADRGWGRRVPGLRRGVAVGCRAVRPDRRRRGGGDQLGPPQQVRNGVRFIAHRLGRQRPGGAGRCAARRVGRRRGQGHRNGDPGASGRGPGRRRPGADLLVVGSRGHVALSGRPLGSVSEHVAARASCRGVVVRRLPDPITFGQRTHFSGRKALSGAGFR
jgi:universal stress protein family protein